MFWTVAAGTVEGMNTFADVDGSTMPHALAAYLDEIAGHPDIVAGKAVRDALLGLRPGMALIDIGCGSGADVLRLADVVGPAGRAVGVDVSEVMLRRAAAAPNAGKVQWCRADALQLPYPDGDFDAARVERTLQHVADPARALGEAVRVVRPGGVICVCEPDWGTLVVGGVPDSLAELFGQRMRARVRHPDMGRRLPALMRPAGATVESVTADAVVTRDAQWLTHTGPLAGSSSDADARQLRRAARRGDLVAMLTTVTVVARR